MHTWPCSAHPQPRAWAAASSFLWAFQAAPRESHAHRCLSQSLAASGPVGVGSHRSSQAQAEAAQCGQEAGTRPLSAQQTLLPAPPPLPSLLQDSTLQSVGLKGMNGLPPPRALWTQETSLSKGNRKQQGLVPLLCKPVASDKPPGSINSACRPQPVLLAVTLTPQLSSLQRDHRVCQVPDPLGHPRR